MALQWLPSFGRGDVVTVGFWTTGLLTTSGLQALILPAITLGLFQMTLIMRLVRGEMLEVLRTDYIKFARARGLTNRAVNFGHALKNTLVPVMTITGLQLGSIIAFAIITETVFQWPGMGLLFLQSGAERRYPDHVGLSAAGRRSSSSPSTSSSTCSMSWSIRASGSIGARPDAMTADRGDAASHRSARLRLASLLDSDFVYSFLALEDHHRRGGRCARLVARRRCSRRWIAPHNPFDLATLSPAQLHTSRRSGSTGGDMRFLLGTDDQGRDVFSTILYGSRHFARRRPDVGRLRRRARHHAGLDRGLYGRRASTP